ncbi:ectoine hydroxylase [Streptomyces capparidis]
MTDDAAPVLIDSGGGAYPPDLYRFTAAAEPLGDAGDIGAEQVARYRRDGFLAVRRLFRGEQVRAVLAGLEAVLRDPRGALVEYEARAADRPHEPDGPDGARRVRKLMGFTGADARLRAAALAPAVLRAARLLTGARDVALIQDMALLKPPGGGREKPWHQDCAFFTTAPGTPVVGVWIALDEAGPDNGCMHVIPGSHRGGPVPHFRRRDFQICDTDVRRDLDVTVPLPPGGALFFDGLLHHGTPANRSPRPRRAVQFHYAPASAPRVGDEERLAVFGAEGRGATC